MSRTYSGGLNIQKADGTFKKSQSFPGIFINSPVGAFEVRKYVLSCIRASDVSTGSSSPWKQDFFVVLLLVCSWFPCLTNTK